MKAPVAYTDGFIEASVAGVLFSALWNELDWERRAAPGMVPRRIEYWTNIYNSPYTYGRNESSRTFESKVTHPVIEAVNDRMLDKGFTDFVYEGCFLNGYDGEKTGLEWHADDDPGIDHSKPIAVVTLYDEIVTPAPVKGKPAARVLQTKLIGGSPDTIESFPLLQGSLLMMAAGMQSDFYHRIPKPGAITRPRISLTFRSLLKQLP